MLEQQGPPKHGTVTQHRELATDAQRVVRPLLGQSLARAERVIELRAEQEVAAVAARGDKSRHERAGAREVSGVEREDDRAAEQSVDDEPIRRAATAVEAAEVNACVEERGRRDLRGSAVETGRHRSSDVDLPWRCGATAAATWICPWRWVATAAATWICPWRRVAAPPRPRRRIRGVETSLRGFARSAGGRYALCLALCAAARASKAIVRAARPAKNRAANKNARVGRRTSPTVIESAVHSATSGTRRRTWAGCVLARSAVARPQRRPRQSTCVDAAARESRRRRG